MAASLRRESEHPRKPDHVGRHTLHRRRRDACRIRLPDEDSSMDYAVPKSERAARQPLRESNNSAAQANGYDRWSAVADRYHQRSTAAAVPGDELRMVGTVMGFTSLDDERRSHIAAIVARRGRFRAVDCLREYRELAFRTRVGTAQGNCGTHRARSWSMAHHPSTFDREFVAGCCRWRGRVSPQFFVD